MIERRMFLGTAAAFVATGCAGAEQHPTTLDSSTLNSLTLAGPLEQGSLVVGKAGAAAAVTVDGNTVSVSPDGRFAFGLAYDQTRATHIVAGATTRDVVPVVRKYDIQTVNGLPQKTVTPPKEVQARIARENALVAEARKRDTAMTAFAETFDWPIKGIVSGTFGNQRIDNGTPMAPHFGVDIAAPQGTPIRAPVDGTVTLAEPDFYLTGGTTMLDHGHGVSTVYLHQSALKVKVGDRVRRGDVIGLVGMKGRATGPHLHWGMNWFAMRLDPSRSAATTAPEKG
ncbi:MAG: M23 family metallopeptidase [Alphaproteobacteria bacterium]|nr:M23 family metallopeptidase [Alphaproteobacteria bacterium]